jgi:hypothetical protein
MDSALARLRVRAGTIMGNYAALLVGGVAKTELIDSTSRDSRKRRAISGSRSKRATRASAFK